MEGSLGTVERAWQEQMMVEHNGHCEQKIACMDPASHGMGAPGLHPPAVLQTPSTVANQYMAPHALAADLLSPDASRELK
jgi:hypothetical protein